MILGRTWKEYYASQIVYAWFPVSLYQDGRVAWFEYVWRHVDEDGDTVYTLKREDFYKLDKR